MSHERSKSVTKALPFPLTEHDLAEQATKIGEIEAKITAHKTNAKAIKSKLKAELEELGEELDRTVRIIQAREEEREVLCVEVHDFDRGVVYWLFHGETFCERPMRESERQMTAWDELAHAS